jgi:MFS family permease
MDNAGAVIGPILAISALVFLTSVWGIQDVVVTLRLTFALAIVPALFAILTTLFVEEKVDHPTASKPFSWSLEGFDSRFKRYLLVVMLFTLGNSADGFLLFRAAEIANTSGWLHSTVMSVPMFERTLSTFGDVEAQRRAVDMLFLPVLWSFFHVVKVLFSAPLGALSDRVGRTKVITAGWCLYALVYAGFALLDSVPGGELQIAAMFVLFTVYAIYYGFTEGAERALVADLVPADRRGSAFGLFNFAVAIGSLPASIVFGVLYQNFGGIIAFGSGAVIALFSVVALRVTIRTR